jgi:hypothetical protein
MHRHGQGGPAGTLDPHMAPALACLHVAKARERSNTSPAGDERRSNHVSLGCHDDVDQLARGFVPRLQTEGDGLGNVRQRLFARFALRHATEQNWAFGDNPSVFTRPQDDGERAHRLNLAPAPTPDNPRGSAVTKPPSPSKKFSSAHVEERASAPSSG